MTIKAEPVEHFFDIKKMPKFRHPGTKKAIYSFFEGRQKEMATKYILDLNPMIEEVGRFLGRSLPTIIPALISWQPKKESVIMFTYLERCPLTKTGKTPKYEYCLNYAAELMPVGFNEQLQTPENYVFGQIFFQKEMPGKAEILIRQKLDGTFIDAKLIDGKLQPWKVREITEERWELKTTYLKP